MKLHHFVALCGLVTLLGALPLGVLAGAALETIYAALWVTLTLALLGALMVHTGERLERLELDIYRTRRRT